MTDNSMRTYIHVDGFNLCYGSLKDTSRRWLDLVAFFQDILQPHHEIVAVKYFTARISGASEPREATALERRSPGTDETSSKIRVGLRHFLTHTLPTPRAPATANVQVFNVAMTEEMARTSTLRAPPDRCLA